MRHTGRVSTPSALSRSLADRRELVGWAASCAERVLGLFEAACPGDDRPRAALTGARAFAAGRIRIGQARLLAQAAHEAARSTADPAARAAARAAGHAVATAHLPGHARHAAAYAADAVALTRPLDPAARREERAWQDARLPGHAADLAVPSPRRAPGAAATPGVAP